MSDHGGGDERACECAEAIDTVKDTSVHQWSAEECEVSMTQAKLSLRPLVLHHD